MTVAHVLGVPRMGANRELKFQVETFWKDTANVEEFNKLKAVAKQIRATNWAEQASRGCDYVTVGDFAWYDHVLGTLSLLGAIPTRHGLSPKDLTLQQYFTMARGNVDMFAMEMTKWFDTNYHYLVPEWTADVSFNGGADWLYEEIAEAQALGHKVKVVLVGPLSLLYLGKIKSGLQHKLDLLPAAIVGYTAVLARIKAAGVTWVQIDEPILALQIEDVWTEKFASTYATLSASAPSGNLLRQCRRAPESPPESPRCRYPHRLCPWPRSACRLRCQPTCQQSPLCWNHQWPQHLESRPRRSSRRLEARRGSSW
jgi:5-methyltetrahydropteroyltriglutamate--homocysteine methyltransferase